MSFSDAEASHIRAGEITAVRNSNLDFIYTYTLVLYTSDDGPTISPDAEILFSDGTTSGTVAYTSANSFGNDITVMKFQFHYIESLMHSIIFR